MDAFHRTWFIAYVYRKKASIGNKHKLESMISKTWLKNIEVPIMIYLPITSIERWMINNTVHIKHMRMMHMAM